MESTEAGGIEISKSSPPPARSLVRKLAEIMGEISRIPKTGYNSFHKYSYVTEADILNAVRAGMAKRSLIILPSVAKTEWGIIGKQQNRLCTLYVDFTVEDGDSGETRVLRFIGEGADAMDKASYKAMTGSEKYVLLKLFMIPTGDDPEKHDPAVEDSAPPPAAEPPAKSPTPKAPAPSAAPRPAPAPEPKQSVALRVRIAALWKTAQGKGTGLDTFQAWAAQWLGRDVKSTEWTEEEVARLEQVANLKGTPPAAAKAPKEGCDHEWDLKGVCLKCGTGEPPEPGAAG